MPVLYQCTCRYKTYFVAVTYVYKGVLLLFGLFLAWETRNVTIPALNDSKYIGMSVYNVVILSAIGAIVVTALDGTRSFEASYAISSLCLIICTTVTLLLVFVPKVSRSNIFPDRDITLHCLSRDFISLFDHLYNGYSAACLCTPDES